MQLTVYKEDIFTHIGVLPLLQLLEAGIIAHSNWCGVVHPVKHANKVHFSQVGLITPQQSAISKPVGGYRWNVMWWSGMTYCTYMPNSKNLDIPSLTLVNKYYFWTRLRLF